MRLEPDFVFSLRLTNDAEIAEAVLLLVPVLLQQVGLQLGEKCARLLRVLRIDIAHHLERVHDPRQQVNVRLLLRDDAVPRVVVKS